MKKEMIALTPISTGDKVVRDEATRNQDTVRLGDGAPVFGRIRAGDKVVRDEATQNQNTVRLGDGAPVFGR